MAGPLRVGDRVPPGLPDHADEAIAVVRRLAPTAARIVADQAL